MIYKLQLYFQKFVDSETTDRGMCMMQMSVHKKQKAEEQFEHGKV
jgi:hypothetical protein